MLAILQSLFGALMGRRVISQRGATAVEYAIMIAAIAGVVLGSVYVLGTEVTGLFSSVDIP